MRYNTRPGVHGGPGGKNKAGRELSSTRTEGRIGQKMAHSFDNVSTEWSVGVEQRRCRQRSAVDNQLPRREWGTPLEVGATNLNAFAAYQSNLVKCESKGSKYSFCQNSLLLCRRENCLTPSESTRKCLKWHVDVHAAPGLGRSGGGWRSSRVNSFKWPDLTWRYGDVVEEVMEDNCTMRPCATDFSIAAIMSRHGRAPRTRCRERDPPDTISPLGKNNKWTNLPNLHQISSAIT